MTTTTRRHDDLDVPALTPAAQRILAVASELFYERGIHAVGVDTIAAESGVTKRTLYDRFESKDNLVAVYLRARHREWWDRLEDRITAAPPPRALAVFDAYSADPPRVDRGCAFLNAAGELPTAHPGYRVVQAHKHAVRRLLTDLVADESSGVDDAEAVADHLFLLLEGAIAHRGIDGDAGLSRRARRIAEGILAQQSAPHR